MAIIVPVYLTWGERYIGGQANERDPQVHIETVENATWWITQSSKIRSTGGIGNGTMICLGKELRWMRCYSGLEFSKCFSKTAKYNLYKRDNGVR